MLQIDVAERDSDSNVLVSHGLFEPNGKVWLLGRALQMMNAFCPLIEVGIVGCRESRRLRVGMFRGELLSVVVFKQAFRLCLVSVRSFL